MGLAYPRFRPILDMVPRYAHTRRAGWTPDAVTPIPMTLPEYLLLRRVAIERLDGPVPYSVLRANALNPYATSDPFLDLLPRLVDLACLVETGNAYELTAVGHDLLTSGEHAANDFTAARIRVPPQDLNRLATILETILSRQLDAPEPKDKSHLLRVAILRQFDRRHTPPVRLEYAIYALQRARDDAHIAAWRGAGLSGPQVELVSRLWAGEARSVEDLVGLERERMSPGDVTSLLDVLTRKSLVSPDHSNLDLTDFGYRLRDQIEHETDRLYFSPWPDIDVGRLVDTFALVNEDLNR